MKLVRQYPHGGTHPPEAVADPKLAPDYRGVQPSLYDLGYDGPVTMRPDLFLDAVGVGELARLGYAGGKYALGALKSLLKSGSDDSMKALAKAAEPQEMYRLVKETTSGRAEREASEAALKAQGERIAKSKLQMEADRALMGASKEHHKAILNLQDRLKQVMNQGLLEEETAAKIFQESVDNIFSQARIDDVVLGSGDKIAKQLGPTMQELYNTNKPLFNSVYNDLIGPLTSRGPKMNEHGGRTPMPHKTIKRYAQG